jgi:hypothetical protein
MPRVRPPLSRLARAGALGACLVALPQAGAAQQPAAAPAAASPPAPTAGAGVLAGTVALANGDALAPDGRGIAGVSVLVGDVGRVARTDSAGRFTMPGLPTGTYRVLVRAVGYQPLEVRARLASGDTTWLQLGVARAAAPQLATVTVRERASGNAAFDARRAQGYGKYFDQDFLQKQQGRQIGDILMMTPGVRLVPQPNGTVAAASRRGQGSMNAATSCYMAIYVDGMRLYEPEVASGSPSGGPSSGGPTPPGLTSTVGKPASILPPNINLLDLGQLGGIEVYAGPAQLPAELRGTGNACGAIVIWTRRQ